MYWLARITAFQSLNPLEEPSQLTRNAASVMIANQQKHSEANMNEIIAS
jgi:hypothetical protein